MISELVKILPNIDLASNFNIDLVDDSKNPIEFPLFSLLVDEMRIIDSGSKKSLIIDTKSIQDYKYSSFKELQEKVDSGSIKIKVTKLDRSNNITDIVYFNPRRLIFKTTFSSEIAHLLIHRLIFRI